MRFNRRARLDRGQVQVRRGAGRPGFGLPGRGSGGRGTSVPIPRGKAGLVLLAVMVVVSLVGGGVGGLNMLGGDPRSAGPVSSSELEECRVGADANADADCARLAVVNSVQDYWERALPAQADRRYVPTDTVLFSDSVDTGCGRATSAVGPFYCPAPGDQQVYLDTTFFAGTLKGRLGAEGGDFAEAYVLAHEYGHHVENLLGVMDRVRTEQGPTSDAVRLELMADCLAGMWAGSATSTTDAGGLPLIEELTREDIREAIDAARAVGDDRIQERTSGQANPDRWTHGSAAAREMWFMTGYEEGSLQACDTWATDRLYPG